MRLQNKIHLYSSALFVLLFVLANLLVYMMYSNQTKNTEWARINAEAENIAANISQSKGVLDPEDLLRAYVPIKGMIRVVQEDATVSFSVASPDETRLQLSPFTRYGVHHNEPLVFEERHYAIVSVPVIWGNGEVVDLQITESLEAIEGDLRVLRNVLIAVTLIALIPVILSSRLLSNLITKPIVSMIRTMEAIRKSGEFKRLELQGRSKDELVEMGQTFNQMIELLETHFEKQEQFVSNASHELKTPLTVIESYASLLKRRGMDHPELFQESVEAIHSEAVRMREMTEQLLLLAKHHDQWDIKLENLDLVNVVRSSVQSFQNAYAREIELEAHGDVSGIADEQKLKQLLFIFMDNARKYSDDKIRVIVGLTEQESFIRIEDRGIGIPKSELAHVFDRFYRVDKARSRKEGGTGLGLSLAQEMAEALNVRIELDSLEGVGTTVTLFFKTSEA